MKSVRFRTIPIRLHDTVPSGGYIVDVILGQETVAKQPE